MLELFRATAHLDDELLVLCDSQYVINAVTKWMAGWKRKGWRKADGKPVMNVELLQQLDEELAGRRYRFEWVKGHVGHELNEAADTRARAVAEAYRRGGEMPSVPAGPGGGAPRSRPQPPSSRRSSSSPSSSTRSRRSPTSPDAAFDATSDDDGAVLARESAVEAWHPLTRRALDRGARPPRAARPRRGLSPEEFLRGLI